MPKSSQVRSLNNDERQWVIDRVATRKFLRELWERLGHLKAWLTTIGAVAGGAVAYVRSDDLAAMLGVVARLFGVK